MLYEGEFQVKYCEVTKYWDVFFCLRTGEKNIVLSSKKESQAKANAEGAASPNAEHLNNVGMGKIRPDRLKR